MVSRSCANRSENFQTSLAFKWKTENQPLVTVVNDWKMYFYTNSKEFSYIHTIALAMLKYCSSCKSAVIHLHLWKPQHSYSFFWITQTMLHPQNPVPAVLTPSEKPATGPVPINSAFVPTPTPVQPPVRTEFPQMVPPVLQHANSQPPVFAGTISHTILFILPLFVLFYK